MRPDDWLSDDEAEDLVREGIRRARARDEADALRRCRALEQPGDVPGALILGVAYRDVTGQDHA